MIYFISAPEVRRIKIGYSTNWQDRFLAIMTASPVDLDVLVVSEGTWHQEQTLHRVFPGRFRGEWFNETPELLAFCYLLKRAPEDRRQSIIAEVVEDYRVANVVVPIKFNEPGERKILTACMRSFIHKHGTEKTKEISGCGEQIIRNWRKGINAASPLFLTRLLRFDREPFQPYFLSAGGLLIAETADPIDALPNYLLDLQRELGALICTIEAEKAACAA